MSFSRSFRSRTWFVHMPGGSIEVMDGHLLERSFTSRMLDGRTPVRAAESQVWSTLAEAGGLAEAEGIPGAERFDASSIGPMAWRAGADLDARKLDGRRGRTAALLAAAAITGLVVLLGSDLASAFAPRPQAREACLLPMPRELVTTETFTARPSSGRLTAAQTKRLVEEDLRRDVFMDRLRVLQQLPKRSALH